MSSDLSWGQRIRLIQKKFGYTMTELALQLEISEGSVYALLRNPKRMPNKQAQRKIQELEQQIPNHTPEGFNLQQLKTSLMEVIKKYKPIIYEADISDVDKLRILRNLKEFMDSFEKIKF